MESVDALLDGKVWVAMLLQYLWIKNHFALIQLFMRRLYVILPAVNMQIVQWESVSVMKDGLVTYAISGIIIIRDDL